MKTLVVFAAALVTAASSASLPARGDEVPDTGVSALHQALHANRNGHGERGTVNGDPSAFIRAAGYPAEAHYTTTDDGYVLRLDRIPRPGATPVFLAHGLFCSSALYLLLGRGKSIGFLLYDAGFDVWLGNYRGTYLSLEHTHLSSSDDEYWKFGWQENGALDNPAMIDYVLAVTGKPRLVYYGHSMGATTFFSMASDRPDMLPKLKAAFVTAPPVFLAHSPDPSTKFAHFFSNFTMMLTDTMHGHQLPYDGLRNFAQVICSTHIGLFDVLCHKLTGMDGDNASVAPDLVSFMPSGGSVWQILHFAQLDDPKWPGFRKFNYGSAKANRAKYGTDSPPDFSLKHIDTPVYMYNGLGDVMCTLEDLAQLRDSLPNVRRFFFSPNPSLGHRDFVFSLSAVDDVWRYMLADMQPYLKQ